MAFKKLFDSLKGIRRKNVKFAAKSLYTLGLYALGFVTIAQEDWRIAMGVFFVLWANNIERRLNALQ